MATRGSTVATVRSLALALPGAFEKPSYGTPGFRVGKQLFARVRDDDHIIVQMPSDVRAAAIEAEPRVFSIIDHYANTPWVIVTLKACGKRRLAELLRNSWLEVGGRDALPPPKRRR